MSLAVLSTASVTAECLALTMALPRRGTMPAHVEVSADSAPAVGEVATLIIADAAGGPPATFVGVVRRARAWAGRVRVVIAQGKGGLRNNLPSRDHLGGILPVSALIVAQGIADATGETLSPLAIPGLLGLTLPRWTRAGADAAGEGGTGIEALDALVSRLAITSGRPEMTWRFLPSGDLWIGPDVFSDGGDTGNVFDDDGDDGSVICAPEAATLLPGTTINGHPAERVTYRINGDTMRAEVLYTVAGDFAVTETPNVYRESHAGTVQAQHADGTIDVQPDDSRLAGNGLRSIPFRIGVPGSSVTLPGGSRVWVAFADADPSQPYAFAIEQDAAASHAFALVGDAVNLGYLTGVAGVTPVTFLLSTVTSPGAVQLTGSITGPGHRYAKGISG